MFKDEIVPVKIKAGSKEIVMKVDESIRWDTSIKKLAELKPAFKEGGTITAGNAPGVNDGASALLPMSEKRAEKLKIKPLARVVGFASGHIDPKWFPVAPVKAIKTLLKKTGKKIEDFDLIEINEAFAAQILAVIKELELDRSRVNVNGGAIALGHPVGSSGSRILVTLVHALIRKRKKMGLAALCLGGGGAMSIAIETAY
jgi:acetyl-CoA C-acetyltransferase